MKKIKEKWKGMRITLNYFGKSNNRFGLKKKKILLEEDKIHSLSDLIETNKSNLKELSNNKKFNSYTIMRNDSKKSTNNSNNNFEYIKIKDFEKAKNFYFFNYFQNMRYFNRVNSYKRILSPCMTPNINSIKKVFHDVSENDVIKNEIKAKNKIKFQKYKTKKKLRPIKIDINKIISDYIQKNKNDNDVFNQKNRTINNNLNYQNRFRNKPKIMKNNYITNIKKNKIATNEICKRCESRCSMHKTSTNYFSLRDSDFVKNNDLKSPNKLFKLKPNNENNIKKSNSIISHKKLNDFDNTNFKQTKQNFFNNLIKKKISSSIDASTNTDFNQK